MIPILVAAESSFQRKKELFAPKSSAAYGGVDCRSVVERFMPLEICHVELSDIGADNGYDGSS